MQLLLDSQALFLWITTRSVPEAVRAAIRDPRNHVVVSAASVWELAIKQQKGKLALSAEQLDGVLGMDFELLDVTAEHGIAAARLPAHHGDPFDRVLIAQAQAEGLTLVGSDGVFAEYDVPVLWD